MKTKNLLVAIATIGLSVFAFSQQTTGNVTQAANANPGVLNGSIKVIDNKGTIKYLQSKNGITMLTNTSADVTTTTWQLGGTLTDNTFIDVNGNSFVLNGVELETGSASTDAADQTDAGAGSGWALLVRDEATGETRKMRADNLLTGIRVEYTAVLADEGSNKAITVTGLPILAGGTTAAKLFVYRNGAKLRFGTDFTVVADTVTILIASLPIYTGDVFEIQYVK